MDARRIVTKRVFVLGDSGVGKSEFRRWLCSTPAGESSAPTVGCDGDIFLFRPPSSSTTFAIEVIELSGNPYYALVRPAFYRNIDGVIFCYNQSDPESQRHLSDWRREISPHYPRLLSHSVPELELVTSGGPVHLPREAPPTSDHMDPALVSFFQTVLSVV